MHIADHTSIGRYESRLLDRGVVFGWIEAEAQSATVNEPSVCEHLYSSGV